MDLNRMLRECITEAEACGIKLYKIDPTVHVNGRLTSTWARCLTNVPCKSSKIEVSRRLLDGTEEAIRDSIMHEVLHAGIGAQNHGNTWKNYALRVNRKYGYNIKRTASADEVGVEKREINYRYEAFCPKCGHTWKKERMCGLIKNPSRWQCKRCKEKLKSRGIGEIQVLMAR